MVSKADFENLKEYIKMYNQNVLNLTNQFKHDFQRINEKVEDLPKKVLDGLKEEIGAIKKADEEKFSDLQYKLVTCEAKVEQLEDKLKLISRDYSRKEFGERDLYRI